MAHSFSQEHVLSSSEGWGYASERPAVVERTDTSWNHESDFNFKPQLPFLQKRGNNSYA